MGFFYRQAPRPPGSSVMIKFIFIFLIVAFISGPIPQANASPFPFSFYRVLSSENTRGNFVFSPYSITKAFQLADFGAKGETLKQIDAVFNYDKTGNQTSENDSNQIFFSANRIWIQKGFSIETQYLNECKTKLAASPGLLDFENASKAATLEINEWVEKQTQGKIKKLIPVDGIDSSTRLVLTNAIYFKAKWQTPIDPAATIPQEFHINPKTSVSVSFMRKKMKSEYWENEEFQILKLPYQKLGITQYEMIVVLPKVGRALSSVEKDLSLTSIKAWESNFKIQEVEISLPKFQFEVEFQLSDSLKRIGLKAPFDSAQANFSGIDGRRDLYIGEVFHKAFLKLDEEGTEAAAATGIGMKFAAMRPKDNPIEFLANRPFLFYIKDPQSDALLFLGRLMNPKP